MAVKLPKMRAQTAKVRTEMGKHINDKTALSESEAWDARAAMPFPSTY